MARFREVNSGQVVSTNDPERIAFFARLGRWVEIADEDTGEDTATPEPEEDTKPATNAPRAKWEAYAIKQGKPRELVESSTVAEIRAWFK